MTATESRVKANPFRLVMGVVIALVYFAAAGVLVGWVNRWLGYPGRPVWGDALFGVMLGAGTLVMVQAQRAGWIPDWFSGYKKAQARQRELVKEREDILDRARADKSSR